MRVDEIYSEKRNGRIFPANMFPFHERMGSIVLSLMQKENPIPKMNERTLFVEFFEKKFPAFLERMRSLSFSVSFYVDFQKKIHDHHIK